MIKPSLNEKGSAHIVIIVILVVVLIGVLGFIFWQNFINKEAANVAETSTGDNETEVDKYAGWNTYTSERDGYGIKYPEDWIAISETDNDGPYIRNFEPTSETARTGYPDGYINLRVLKEENNTDFKTRTSFSTTEWYETLGKEQVQTGAVGYLPDDVKAITVNGISAKSAKSVFTETNEVIYFLKGETLYSINLYPYGVSSDSTVKLMLDSFSFL